MTRSRPRLLEVHGTPLAVRLAGDARKPALLLIHGFPSSSASFRRVIGPLARECFVVAPDLPGFGASQPIEGPTFSRFADLVDGLLAQLGIESFLIVQNANAHLSVLGAQWAATRGTIPRRCGWPRPART
ncbi:alpha/beta fold hydrolase [Caldimonas sp. KR1-144]|uniref:alpha/beta fold hydrolase n=1 Tax=Caldimonas sp. KR1-144 TaxID=3400911 RepID=UPI003C07D1D5